MGVPIKMQAKNHATRWRGLKRNTATRTDLAWCAAGAMARTSLDPSLPDGTARIYLRLRIHLRLRIYLRLRIFLRLGIFLRPRIFARLRIFLRLGIFGIPDFPDLEILGTESS